MLEGGNSSKMRIDSGNRKNQILIFSHLMFWKVSELRKLLKTKWWAIQDLNL